MELEFGLLITLIGAAAVFGSLAIIALVSITLKRLFKTEPISEPAAARPPLTEGRKAETSGFKIRVDGEEHEVKVEELGVLGKESGEPTLPPEAEEKLRIIVDGEEHTVDIEGAETATVPVERAVSKPSEKSATESKHVISAPVQGTVVKVHVRAGDRVAKGTTVLVLETMKMENAVQSPISGVVKAVMVSEGDAVSADDVLIMID